MERAGRSVKLPPPGHERDAIADKALKLSQGGMSLHNVALELDIPFGSVSRLITKYKVAKDLT